MSTAEPHDIEKLPVGKYRLVEKKAPAGFGYAEDVWFEVLDTGEIQKVEMFDKEQSVDVEKSVNVQKVKPKQQLKYTIEIVKNCSDEMLDNFTMTDKLPKYVRLKSLSTGTYNQELTYTAEYQTNKNSTWRTWKDDLKTSVNYYLTSPEGLQKGEYMTAFRFCFGSVGGRFSQEISPEYTVTVTENALGILRNQLELTAMVDGEKLIDKDETETPAEVPPKPEPITETPDDSPEFYPVPEVEYSPSVRTGDDAGIEGILGMVFISLLGFFGIRTCQKRWKRR